MICDNASTPKIGIEAPWLESQTELNALSHL
jgi:hypothetical protein